MITGRSGGVSVCGACVRSAGVRVGVWCARIGCVSRDVCEVVRCVGVGCGVWGCER